METNRSIKLGNIFHEVCGGSWGGNVYDRYALSPTLNTMQGGDRQPLIIDRICVASRGRNPDNPSDRSRGGYTEQRLEPKTDGLCNTITTVQKDNMILEIWDGKGNSESTAGDCEGVD